MGRAEDRFNDGSGVAVAQARALEAPAAVAELAAQLPADGLAMILVFASPVYDPHQFSAELTKVFGDIPIYGCTTAGELTPDGWGDNSVVALGFSAEDFTIVARPVLDLANFRMEDGRRIGNELREALARSDNGDSNEKSFGLLLIDGLCQREEAVMSSIYASLDNIPVVGGSAGDGLRFEKTWVFYGGKAHTDAAILILLKTSLPFRLFKCDNFEPSATKMVVTEADIERRIVKEINAEPAAEEYSRAVGIMDTKLDMFSFASHPVLVRAGDIDVTWLNGYGWPQDKGGPMFLGDRVGLQRVLDVVERASKNIADIKVSNLLRSMAKDGRKFADLKPQKLTV